MKRELKARDLSANRLALDLSVPSGRITDILNGRRSITADTAVRLGRYFGNRANSGLICRANTTSLSLSVSVVLRSRAVCDQRMRREVQ